MSKKQRLFIVCLYGVYGGQWYCAVYADKEIEAVEKGKNKYNINKDTWKEFEEYTNITSNASIETELVFDRNGISNVWQILW